MDGPMDGLCQVERSFSFSQKEMLRSNRSKKGSEKEGKKDGSRHPASGFDQLIHKIEEREKEFLILFWRNAARAQRPFEAGKEGKEKPGLEHQTKRRA